MTRLLSTILLATAALLFILVACSEDDTTAPPTTISVTSYINRVYDGDYAVGQEFPAHTDETEVIITQADSIMGQGGLFSIHVSHGNEVEDIIIGAVDAVGYFVVPVADGAEETTIGGTLTVANEQSFAFKIAARRSDSSVLKPGQHSVRVITSDLVKFYISEVQGAEYHEAELPEPTKGQTIVSVEGEDHVINGGSNEVNLSVIVPAEAIIIGVDGAFGYFRLPTQGLPGEIDVLMFIAQTAHTSFPTVFMTEEPGRPEYGLHAIAQPILINVGSGDLQVSLAFTPSHDLDLHLVEPTGEEIYYGNRTSEAGGHLDLDSNAACNQDHVNNENITYNQVTPPSGEYIVRVDFWQSCDGTGAEFRVITSVKGEVNLYRDTFEASDADGGGAGSGREICRFSF